MQFLGSTCLLRLERVLEGVFVAKKQMKQMRKSVLGGTKRERWRGEGGRPLGKGAVFSRARTKCRCTGSHLHIERFTWSIRLPVALSTYSQRF